MSPLHARSTLLPSLASLAAAFLLAGCVDGGDDAGVLNTVIFGGAPQAIELHARAGGTSARTAPALQVSSSSEPTALSGSASGAGRGISSPGPWVSYYGSANRVDLARMASTFRLFDIDADPGLANFTRAQIGQLRAGGANKVLSYLNIGSCESFRDYWKKVPSGFLSCSANKAAQRGTYAGYADELWMDPGNYDYQHLIVDYVAPRLVAQGVDGFYLDNMEIVEHGTMTRRGRCDAACLQGGLDLVRKLREKYPGLTIVMQNATSDVTRLGTSGGSRFATLLDGIAHEEVYGPVYDADAEAELSAWYGMGLKPGREQFWVGTLDYVGSCSNMTDASLAFSRSRARHFTPSASDASSGQNIVCYWPF